MTPTSQSFSLLVRSSPLGGVNHTLALSFVKAALKQGHRINRVFFYQDGVYIGLAQQAPQGQVSLHEQWLALAQEGGFPLQCCIANAVRRGLLDATEAARYDRSATLAAGYELCGLGEMVAAHQDSDRLLTF